MVEQRKLAAIVFTDIVGYTRLMSHDEPEALRILEKNMELQKFLVQKHRGKFLKEMGDGTLLSFRSALDAVNCAMEIQYAIKDEEKLNLRIGIHIGDIVFKRGDIFGDGVNVASRIEQHADSGCVCISEPVYETIKNKPGIEAEYIGEKYLKNVDHPVKLYALRKDGRSSHNKNIFRSKHWMWLKERKYASIAIVVLGVFAIISIINLIKNREAVKNLDKDLLAVAVFENKSGDESLDLVGPMTSDWITQGIAGTGLVSVVPSFTLEATNDIHQNMDGILSLAEETHAQTIITGVFYKHGNNIQFHSNVVDAGEGELLNAVGPVNGPVSDPLKSIELLRQKLMGSLAANFDPHFISFSDRILQPPLFDAYQEFLTGQELYYQYKFNDAIQHFYKAAKLDTTYFLPLVWASGVHFSNGFTLDNIDEYRKSDSLNQIIKKHQGELTPGEQHMLDYLIAWLDGDLEGVYQAARLTAQYSIVFKYELGWAALRANHLQETIDVMTALEPDKYLFKGRYWWVLTKAHHLLGNYKKELKIAQRGRKKHAGLFSALWNELRALAATGNIDEIIRLYEQSLNFLAEPFWNPAYLMLWTATELRVHGYPSASKTAITHAIEWYQAHPDDNFRFELAQAYYVADQLDKSREIFEKLAQEEPGNIDCLGYLGAIAVRTGDQTKAENICTLLVNPDRPYLFGRHTCWRARIAALSGDKEFAIQLLRDAIAQGFDYYSLHEIIDFTSLYDYPPYIELIKPK